MYLGTIADFLNMGGGEITLILVVVLLLFGGKKLPELARGLGKGIRDFKDASEGVKREIHRNINAMDVEDDHTPARTADAHRFHPEDDSHIQPEGYSNDPANVDPVAGSVNDTKKEPQADKA